jgi:hypothetical protein
VTARCFWLSPGEASLLDGGGDALVRQPRPDRAR